MEHRRRSFERKKRQLRQKSGCIHGLVLWVGEAFVDSEGGRKRKIINLFVAPRKEVLCLAVGSFKNNAN